MDENIEITLRDKEQQTADAFGITYRVEELKRDLLAVDGVVDVEFDLEGYWSNIQQIIFLPRYDVPLTDKRYYTKLMTLIARVLEVCAAHGLIKTGDPIEDYGEHLYFVTDCNWPVKPNVTIPDGMPL